MSDNFYEDSEFDEALLRDENPKHPRDQQGAAGQPVAATEKIDNYIPPAHIPIYSLDRPLLADLIFEFNFYCRKGQDVTLFFCVEKSPSIPEISHAVKFANGYQHIEKAISNENIDINVNLVFRNLFLPCFYPFLYSSGNVLISKATYHASGNASQENLRIVEEITGIENFAKNMEDSKIVTGQTQEDFFKGISEEFENIKII